MSSSFGHGKFRCTHPDFYEKLTAYLGWEKVVEYPDGFGVTDGRASLWFFKGNSEARCGDLGLDHLAFAVASRREVDAFYETYLTANKIPVLYGEPGERPEYVKGYYSVYFKDPDGFKVEVMTINSEK